MTEYIRPQIQELEFRDSSGAIINYGSRWEHSEGPPENMYSVVDHPERFAPLEVVAAAVIKYICENYEIEAEEGSHVTEGLLHLPELEQITRAVRLAPRAEFAAPITFVMTSFPAIRLYAGALFESLYPPCGCNACDESWQGCADELEQLVFAIVNGGLKEQISQPRRAKWSFHWGKGLVRGMKQSVSSQLLMLDGVSGKSSETNAEYIPTEVLETAKNLLTKLQTASVEGNWPPWAKRESVA